MAPLSVMARWDVFVIIRRIRVVFSPIVPIPMVLWPTPQTARVVPPTVPALTVFIAIQI